MYNEKICQRLRAKIDRSLFPDQENGKYRVLLLMFRPNFSAKKKNIVQPTRIFCTSRISWNRISDWLPIVFHFGTDNWEEQLKKHPVQMHGKHENKNWTELNLMSLLGGLPLPLLLPSLSFTKKVKNEFSTFHWQWKLICTPNISEM